MSTVTPINQLQKDAVVAQTYAFIRRGENLFQKDFEDIPVLFDLRARASGMYRVEGSSRVLRYNPWVFSRYFDDCLATTVPHEVAHYLADVLFGIRNIRPHGKEWKAIMMAFGVAPRVRSHFSLDGIPLRQMRRFAYRCQCMEHQVTSRRHNRILKGFQRYRCRRCGFDLEACS